MHHCHHTNVINLHLPRGTTNTDSHNDNYYSNKTQKNNSSSFNTAWVTHQAHLRVRNLTAEPPAVFGGTVKIESQQF